MSESKKQEFFARPVKPIMIGFHALIIYGYRYDQNAQNEIESQDFVMIVDEPTAKEIFYNCDRKEANRAFFGKKVLNIITVKDSSSDSNSYLFDICNRYRHDLRIVGKMMKTLDYYVLVPSLEILYLFEKCNIHFPTLVQDNTVWQKHMHTVSWIENHLTVPIIGDDSSLGENEETIDTIYREIFRQKFSETYDKMVDTIFVKKQVQPVQQDQQQVRPEQILQQAQLVQQVQQVQQGEEQKVKEATKPLTVNDFLHKIERIRGNNKCHPRVMDFSWPLIETISNFGTILIGDNTQREILKCHSVYDLGSGKYIGECTLFSNIDYTKYRDLINRLITSQKILMLDSKDVTWSKYAIGSQHKFKPREEDDGIDTMLYSVDYNFGLHFTEKKKSMRETLYMFHVVFSFPTGHNRSCGIDVNGF
jgi:hypothetical protein